MDLVTGAIGSLVPKLLQVEYKLQKDLRNDVKSLCEEMESIAAALHRVAEVPWYQLDEQDKVWAHQIRDTSYDMEDVLDMFLVRIKGNEHVDPSGLKRAMKKMGDLFTKGKSRHDIANAIKSIKEHVQVVAERRQRYKIDDNIVAKPAATTNDPRLSALYKKPSQLVGINEPRDAIIEMLSVGEGHTSCKEKKIVSIVGFGGLGKTTLAKAVLDKVNSQFDCCAFVPVGQNPDRRKVLRDILIEFENDVREKTESERTKPTSAHEKRSLSLCDLKELDQRQLINQLRKYLEGKRYFIIVDDIWDTSTWRTVNLAFVDANCARILVTTRISHVSTEVGEVYRIEGLSANNSKKLLYTITTGGEEHRPTSDELDDEVTDTIIEKCRGVPLAIITIAGVLARKPTKEWFNVYNSIGFRPEDDQVEDMKKILSFSYYNLPYRLKTCFLYLSVFPEEYFIQKNNLILRWEAEGFIEKESGRDFIEVGNSYFQELINRSMVIPMEDKQSGLLDGCRIHDMLLRLIQQISVEENFIVALRGEQQSLVAQDNIRRLALQMINVETNYKDMGRVRSFVAIIGGTKLFPSLCSFKALRVLVLEYCIGMEGYPLKHIVKLLHLRYIGLSHTPVPELPKEIGCLRFLQTLLLDDTGLKELPASVRLLKQLVCLHVDEMTRVPDWIGELTSLVELQMYHEVVKGWVLSGSPRVVDREDHYGADNECSTGRYVKELGKLENLRVLKTGINLQDQVEGLDFLESLRNLHKIQDISTSLPQKFFELEVAVETNFTLSSTLRSLQLLNLKFPRLPAWMNGQCLRNLCQLKVVVNDVEDQDLQILGTLQELRDLVLIVIRVHRLKLNSCGCDGFQNLRFLNLTTVPLLFLKGAMPRLENINFSVEVMELKGANIGFDFGLENLSSLQSVNATIDCADSSTTVLEEMETAIRHAVDINPNHPALVVKRQNEDKMVTPADYVDSIGFSRLMYTMCLNKEIQKLNQQIEVQTNYNNKLYSEAREVAELLPKQHPCIAKMQLQRQVADATLFNQRMQIMKDQEQLLELYDNENKKMALIKEEMETAIRHAVDTNPNRPALVVKRQNEDKMVPPAGDVDSIGFSRLMYTMPLNKEIQKLNQQIEVQANYNNKLYSEAREVAELLPEQHPCIAKMQLQRQVADATLFNQRMQIMKDQEQLLELYDNENKKMALIKEELKAALNISHHVADVDER